MSFRLCVQLQPERAPGLDVRAAVSWFQQLDSSVIVSEGEDDGPYVNLLFEPTEPLTLWMTIRSQLATARDLARAAIVTCTGSRGWDDYRLLHHFDRTLGLDELAEPGQHP